MPLWRLCKSNLWLWQEVGKNCCIATTRYVKESSHSYGEEQCGCQRDGVLGRVLERQFVCVGPQC